MRASYCLFVEFSCKDFQRPEEYHRKGIKAIISLFLSSATRLRLLVDDNIDLKNACDQEFSLAINGFYTQVNSLFRKAFDTAFGGCDRDFYEFRSKMELQVYI